MKKHKVTGLIHKNNGLIQVDEDPFDHLSPPTRLELVQGLLYGLQNAREEYVDRFMKFDKSLIPREFSHIFWGLQREVEDFLIRFEAIQHHTLPGKKVGRKRNLGAKRIAAQVLKDYKKIKGDPSAIPTGQYLFEKITEIINAKALAKEPCPEYIDLRTCQAWKKEMKAGTFEADHPNDDAWSK